MSQDPDFTENITAEALDKQMKAVCHPDTHPSVLEHIASSAPLFLVKRVADHPRTEAHTLDRLARHEHFEVRAALAENQNIAIEVQWQLAEDEHPDVRFALAQSYVVDTAVLAALTEDDNPFVANRARTTLQRRDLDVKKNKKTHTLPQNSGGTERKRFRALG